MTFEHDYYAILGVPADADDQAIKRAYRQLARRYHPDTSTEEDAAAQFIAIQEAYEVLTEPLQREAYDQWRRQSGMAQPLPLQLRVTPSQGTMSCLGETQALYVLVEISASGEAESQRMPLNLSLVLDRSTSMKGARLQQVKEAARHIVDQMGPDDVLSVVTFSDKARLVFPGQRHMDKSAARSAISAIRSGGGTELLQGLQLGLNELERWKTEQAHNHLLLLTDGQTYGDEEECLEAARHAGGSNISLTMMGVGSDWNDKLLDEMASLSHGTSVYIDSSSKIAKAFHDRIRGLGSTIAQQVVLTVYMSEQVTLKEAHRVSPQIDRLNFYDNRVTLGSLEKQQPQAVMLELLIASHKEGTHRLLQADVEGQIPALSQQPFRARQTINLPFETNLDRRSPIPPDIVSAMGKLTIYKMQERTMADIEMGQIEPAVRRLKNLATRLLDIGEAELARAALLEAGRLSSTGTLSAKGYKQIRYGTRGLTILPKEVRHDKMSSL